MIALDLNAEQQMHAVGDGVYQALTDVFDATGGYPWTRDDLIAAIHNGARAAVLEFLRHNPNALRPEAGA